MHKRILAAAAVVAAFSVVACGSSDSSSGGTGGTSGSGGSSGSGGGTTVPLKDLSQQLATTLCDVVDQCLGSYYKTFLNGQDCVTLNQREADQGDLSVVQQSIDAGKVKYHGDKVAACLDAIKSAGCSLFSSRLPAACQDVFEGTVAAGGDCAISEECVGDNICQVSGSTCPGKCGPRAASGAACVVDDDCQSGLNCQSGSCVTAGQEGANCGGSSPDCVTGLYCAGYDAQNGIPGKCTKLDSVFNAAQGQPCDASKSQLCQVGSACEVAINGTTATYTCVAPVASGAACKLAFPTECPSGEYCNIPAATPPTIDGTCTKLPAAGEACTSGGQCAAYNICDPATTKCVALANDGASCATDAACYSKHCVSGTCKAGPCTP